MQQPKNNSDKNKSQFNKIHLKNSLFFKITIKTFSYGLKTTLAVILCKIIQLQPLIRIPMFRSPQKHKHIRLIHHIRLIIINTRGA